MEKNTVIILGAGFSKGIAELVGQDMPLTNNFIAYAYKYIKDSDQEFKYRTFLSFITTFYKLQSQEELSSFNISIEDVLSIIELRSDNNVIQLGTTQFYSDELRRQLIDLIIMTLEHYSVLLFAGEGQREKWNKLVSHLYEFLSGPSNIDTIISFNWDLVADIILAGIENVVGHSGYYDPYYTNGFEPFRVVNGNKPYRYSDNKPVDDITKIKLLKMHGSIGWAKCPECNKIYLCEIETLGSNINDLQCQADNAKLNILIIPPSIEKNIRVFPFTSIWRRAYNALMNATDLIVMGFSLREEDYQVKYLIQHSIANRTDKFSNVTLIDPNYKQLLGKYQKVLNIVIKEKQCFDSIKTYLDI